VGDAASDLLDIPDNRCFDKEYAAIDRPVPRNAQTPRQGRRSENLAPAGCTVVMLADRRLTQWLRIVGDAVVETVYPRRCAGCGRRGRWVCDECARSVRRFAPPWCERCGAPAGLAVCRCADLPGTIAVIRSAALDEAWLRDAIRSFKYAGETARADHLAALLVPLLADLPSVDGLVPVPLHPRRERRRGYNQARKLGARVAAASGIALDEVLVRTRSTAQQVGLDAAARRANVRGAFAVRAGRNVRGGSYLLIDDVLTTGATLGNCADTLVTAGAAWVGAMTLARED
jgi:ComF family protein